LLQHAPVPGALQDAAAVYAHIVINVLGATPSANGIYTYPTVPTDSHSSSGSSEHANEHEPLHTPYANTPKPTDFTGHPRRARNVKIVLIGDSAGGNLVLGLARWIRDEGALPEPDGLLLLSPSCDPCKRILISSLMVIVLITELQRMPSRSPPLPIFPAHMRILIILLIHQSLAHYSSVPSLG
jgi:hypothetical protein